MATWKSIASPVESFQVSGIGGLLSHFQDLRPCKGLHGIVGVVRDISFPFYHVIHSSKMNFSCVSLFITKDSPTHGIHQNIQKKASLKDNGLLFYRIFRPYFSYIFPPILC